jgi:hypothetical protein
LIERIIDWIISVSKASQRPSDLLAQITVIDWSKVTDLWISVFPSNCFKNLALNQVIYQNSWSQSLELDSRTVIVLKTLQLIKLSILIDAHCIGDESCTKEIKGILAIDWKHWVQHWIGNRYQCQSLFYFNPSENRVNYNDWIIVWVNWHLELYEWINNCKKLWLNEFNLIERDHRYRKGISQLMGHGGADNPPHWCMIGMHSHTLHTKATPPMVADLRSGHRSIRITSPVRISKHERRETEKNYLITNLKRSPESWSRSTNMSHWTFWKLNHNSIWVFNLFSAHLN